MVMMRNDKRVGSTPATPAKKLGEAVGEAAAEVGKILGDDLKLGKKGPSAEEINKALDRLDAAEKKARLASVGTLGALPQYKQALAELSAAQAEVAALRERDPKLVGQLEAQREAKASKGFWDGLKSVGLFVVSPGLWLASKLFGKND